MGAVRVVDLAEFRRRRPPQPAALPVDAPSRSPLRALPEADRRPLTARQQAHRRRMLQHLIGVRS